MLWNGGPTPGYTLGSGTNSFGSTYTDTGIGTGLTTGAANTKGSNTNCLNGLAAEGYGLSVFISGGATATAERRFMVDILIDYAAGAGNAGSSWTTLVANLYANSPAFTVGGCGVVYYFPIIIPRGAALGAAAQCNAATQSLRVAIATPQLNTRPEGSVWGNQVQTIGATTASTTGVSVTPGTGAKGSYSASIGTLSRNSFWFQLGVGSSDTTMAAAGYLFDLAAGPSQEKMCIYDMIYGVNSGNEQAFKGWGQMLPQRLIPAGSDLYARAAACGGGPPDDAMTVVAYAVS